MTGPSGQGTTPVPDGLPLVRATLALWRAAAPSRVPPSAALAVGWTVLFVAGAIQEPLACTELEPCGPDWYGSVLLGAAVAVLLWCFWVPRLGVAAGVPLGLALLIDAALAPPGLSVVIVLGALVALGAIGLVAARVLDVQAQAADDLVAAAPHARWPGTVPVQPPQGRWAGGTLLAIAAACVVYGAVDGRGEAAREQDAVRERGSVVAASDDGLAVDVEVGGQVLRLETIDATLYPIGSDVTVLRAEGGDRLAAEPYDASSWGVLGSFLAAVGATLIVRGSRRRRTLRALFELPQPVYRAAVVPAELEAVVVPTDVRVGPGALCRLPVVAVPYRTESAAADHDDWDDKDEEFEQAHRAAEAPVTVERLPARIFGLPLPGRTVVALTDDGEALLPLGPARRVAADWRPPFEAALHRPVEVISPAVSDQETSSSGSPARDEAGTSPPDITALDALLAPSHWRWRSGVVSMVLGLGSALYVALTAPSRGVALLGLLPAAQAAAGGLWSLTAEVRADRAGVRVRGPMRELLLPWACLAAADVVDRVLVLRTRTGRLVPLPAAAVPLRARQARADARQLRAQALQVHISSFPSGHQPLLEPSEQRRPYARLTTASFVVAVAVGILLRGTA